MPCMVRRYVLKEVRMKAVHFLPSRFRDKRVQWYVPSTSNDKQVYRTGAMRASCEWIFSYCVCVCEAHERKKREKNRNNGYWKQKTRQDGMWSGEYAEMISESVDLHTWMEIRAHSPALDKPENGNKNQKKKKTEEKTKAFIVHRTPSIFIQCTKGEESDQQKCDFICFCLHQPPMAVLWCEMSVKPINGDCGCVEAINNLFISLLKFNMTSLADFRYICVWLRTSSACINVNTCRMWTSRVL